MRRSLLFAALLTAAVGLGPHPAAGQCLLANPSFEIDGSGVLFGGWNQFGAVARTTTASHGDQAVALTGPDSGSWDVSGVWQPFDGGPGDQWRITGHVLLPSGGGLAAQSRAIVNVEWRDAADDLIDYDSFAVAAPGAPLDTWLDFDLTSTPAPAGTASARLLLGVLQGPGDPVPSVVFDQVTFSGTASPTVDEIQWNDFPGGRVLSFAGRDWRVKGDGYYGPGPNWFLDDPANVFVDGEGALHLTVQTFGATWISTEVTAVDALGYGDYVLTTRGALDQLDPQVVCGMFLWEYGPCWDPAYLWWNPYNEIDIEYSRWENPAADPAQFVAQPWDWSGNRSRFDAAFGPDEIVSHAMRWLPDRVEYRVWRGDATAEATSPAVHNWTYGGPHVPRPEQPRLHLNLWRIAGTPAGAQEVVFTDFRFTPAGAPSAAPDPQRPPAAVAAGRLRPASPNPFNPQTTLRFELVRPARITLAIHDAAGRLVRTLVDGSHSAGEHRTVWDGRDAAGRTAASGVYFAVLSGPGFVESGRLVLLK